MAENPTTGPERDRPAESGIQPTPEVFLTGTLFPSELHAPEPAPEIASPARRTKFWTQIVLPFGILLVAIAILAFMSQDPLRQVKVDNTPPPAAPAKATVEFTRYDSQLPLEVAVWDPMQLIDPKTKQPKSHWLPEYEISGRGYYDFEFSNPSNVVAEFGVQPLTCDCSTVFACVVPAEKWSAYQQQRERAIKQLDGEPPRDDFTWHEFNNKAKTSLDVPPGGRGVVRLKWIWRAGLPDRMEVEAQTWARPKASPDAKPTSERLVARISYVKAARLYPQELNLGEIREGGKSSTRTLYIWSATRDLEVKDVGIDKCLEQKVEKLNAQDIEKVTAELAEKGIFTRIRSAYQVQLQLHEGKDGKLFDLGPFERLTSLEVRGDDEKLDVTQAKLRGTVRGEVQMLHLNQEITKIRLGNFTPNDEVRFKVELTTKPGVVLEMDSFEPPFLNFAKSKLEKQGEVGKDGLWRWHLYLHATVISEVLDAGPLPDTSAVVLRIQGQGTTRKVRFPILGSVSGGRD